MWYRVESEDDVMRDPRKPVDSLAIGSLHTILTPPHQHNTATLRVNAISHLKRSAHPCQRVDHSLPEQVSMAIPPSHWLLMALPPPTVRDRNGHFQQRTDILTISRKSSLSGQLTTDSARANATRRGRFFVGNFPGPVNTRKLATMVFHHYVRPRGEPFG